MFLFKIDATNLKSNNNKTQQLTILTKKTLSIEDDGDPYHQLTDDQKINHEKEVFKNGLKEN